MNKETVQISKWFSGLAAISTLIIGLGGAHASVPATASVLKIGFVDVEKAVQETSSGKKAKKELEKELSSKKAEFQKKEADLKKMFEDLEKKKVALSDDVRTKKQADLNQDMAKFQREVSEFNIGMQKKQSEYLQPIAEKLEGIIEKIAKSGSYSVVLDKRALVWGDKQIDITDEVVKEFEKNAK
jgi:outer membrane protein